MIGRALYTWFLGKKIDFYIKMNDRKEVKSMTDTPSSLATPTDGYTDWLLELKGHIHNAQRSAALWVNQELVLLYRQIGQDIQIVQRAVAQLFWWKNLIAEHPEPFLNIENIERELATVGGSEHGVKHHE